MTMDHFSEYKAIQNEINAALETYFTADCPQKELLDAMRYSLLAGGKRIRPLLPHTFLLIPGYGAQGGTGRDIAGFFRDGIRGVVNNSRGILTAHKGKSEDVRFTDHTRKATLDMKQDILQWLK